MKTVILAAVCVMVLARAWQNFTKTRNSINDIKDRRKKIEHQVTHKNLYKGSALEAKLKADYKDCYANILTEKIYFCLRVVESLLYLSPIAYISIKYGVL